MHDPHVLLVFASDHGHTARIADRMAARIRAAGLGVDVARVDRSPRIDPDRHVAVVAGGSVHVGHHQRALRTWLREHRAALDPARTALFSVSMAGASDDRRAQEQASGYLQELAADLGAEPALARSFAGALQYRAYGFPLRVVMRAIARRRHLPTDPHEDVVLTDWEAVDAFAADVAARLPTPVGA